MNRRKWTDEQFIEAFNSSLSYAEILRKLKLKVAGSNYDTIKRKIKDLNLDTSHMTGQGWNVGDRFRIVKKAKPLSEILVEHSDFVNMYFLKKRLLKENIKKCKCEMCGLSEWKGKSIPLELHHINGIKDDLRLENLMILCPNCHAFTDNYRGKNICA
uniref:NinG recombination protein n=1 Tax=Dulem virus 42 TaxID=3145760 RepID=A0AAU8BB57_9CAUD